MRKLTIAIGSLAIVGLVVISLMYLRAKSVSESAHLVLDKLVGLRASVTTMDEARLALESADKRDLKSKCAGENCTMEFYFDNSDLSRLHLSRPVAMAVSLRFKGSLMTGSLVMFEVSAPHSRLVYITDGGCVKCVPSERPYYRVERGGNTIIDLTVETDENLRRQSLALNTAALSSLIGKNDVIELIRRIP